MLRMQKELTYYSIDSAKKALFSSLQNEFMLYIKNNQKNNINNDNFLENLQIEWFEEIPSTNLYLFQSKIHQEKTQLHNQVHLCTAWSQTAGIGTHQRQWLNQPYQGLLFSLAFHLPKLEYGLSLMIGYAIVQALNEIFADDENAHANKQGTIFQIKWPNDIYLEGQKLGGVLIQSRHYKSEISGASGIYVVVGVGLNLGEFKFNNNNEDLVYANLNKLLNNLNNLNNKGADFYFKLFAKILKYIWQNINAFQNQGLEAYIPEISKLLYQPQAQTQNQEHIDTQLHQANSKNLNKNLAKTLAFTYQGQKINVLECELLKQGFLQVLTEEGKVLVLK